MTPSKFLDKKYLQCRKYIGGIDSGYRRILEANVLKTSQQIKRFHQGKSKKPSYHVEHSDFI